MAYHLIREFYTINSIKGQFSIIVIVTIICSHSQNVWILGVILKNNHWVWVIKQLWWAGLCIKSQVIDAMVPINLVRPLWALKSRFIPPRAQFDCGARKAFCTKSHLIMPLY